MARIEGAYTFVSLKFRLESNKEEKKKETVRCGGRCEERRAAPRPLRPPCPAFGVRVQGLGFRVSGFGFRV